MLKIGNFTKILIQFKKIKIKILFIIVLTNGDFCFLVNKILNLSVMTKQEILIQMPIIKNLKKEEEIIVEYK